MLPQQQEVELLDTPYDTAVSWGCLPSETVKAHLTFALPRQKIALSFTLFFFSLSVLFPAYNDGS